MQYLKIWTSFEENLDGLSNEEVGSLLRNMLQYAANGTADKNFVGNERFVWAAARQMIDAAREKSEKMSKNGANGGRPKQEEADDSEEKQNKPNETKQNQTKANKSLKDKDKVYVKDKVKEQEEWFERFWAVYPRKVAKENARKAFAKVCASEDVLSIILRELERQKKSIQWMKDDGQYIPYPATWLNGKRYEDEITPVVTDKSFTQRDYTDVPGEMIAETSKEVEEFIRSQKECCG